MSRSKKERGDRPPELSDLQLAVMRVLWRQGRGTVAEVHEALEPERGLAPTTIATTLQRLEKRGVVAHETEGRQYVYRAVHAESDVRRSMVGALTDRLFRGDAAELVNHLLAEREIEPAELERLMQRIRVRQAQDEEQGR
jgi:predicted transcriptional regulator